MHPAQAMIQGCPIPSGTMLIGYIDKHPADDSGIGWAVLFYASTGVEIAWDGQKTRSLPNNWRKKSPLTEIDPASALGRIAGMATTKAKADAARANGAKGGRPRNSQNDAMS